MDYIVIGGPPPFVRHSEDSSIMANSPGPGSDTTCKNYGHHLSPHWYDIVHFGQYPLGIYVCIYRFSGSGCSAGVLLTILLQFCYKLLLGAC